MIEISINNHNEVFSFIIYRKTTQIKIRYKLQIYFNVNESLLDYHNIVF